MLSVKMRLLRQVLFRLKITFSLTIVASPAKNRSYPASKPIRFSLTAINVGLNRPHTQ